MPSNTDAPSRPVRWSTRTSPSPVTVRPGATPRSKGIDVGQMLWLQRHGTVEQRRILWDWLEPQVRALADWLLRVELASDQAVVNALISDALDHASAYAPNIPVNVWLPQAIGERALMVWGRVNEAQQRALIIALLPRFNERGQRIGRREPLPRSTRANSEARYRAALERLPPLYRMVLVLTDVYAVSRPHMCEMLTSDPVGTRLLIHHARLAVTEFLFNQRPLDAD